MATRNPTVLEPSVHSIRFIYFDLGNVLLHFSHQVACENMAALANVSPQLVRQLVFEANLELAYERGELTTEQFYEQFCSGTGSRPDMKALSHASADIFTLNEGMLPILHRLKNNGHRLGILSNTCIAHWDFCLENYAHLRELFDVFALSFELRSMKPELEIYERAARMAEVAPHEIFFTDDREENVEGALAAGYDAVLFESAEQCDAELQRRGL